jgi:hypothetical protein
MQRARQPSSIASAPETEETSLLSALDLAGDLGLSLAPAFLIHFCLVWARGGAGWGVRLLLADARKLVAAGGQRTTELQWLLGAALLIAAVTCAGVARRSGQRLHGSFLIAFALTLDGPGAACWGPARTLRS